VNYELSDEQELLRRTVREFAETRVAPVAEELDREERFPYELVAELAELGLMGIPIPQEYGGAGADTVSYAIAIEELTRIDSSVAITVAAHTSLGTMPILLYGDERQRDEWLPPLAEHADGVFVEDTAVLMPEIVVITRPGVASRRPEVESVAAALAGRLEVRRISAPACLEGGDVLRIGSTLYVGTSGRTSRAGRTGRR